MRTCPSFVEAHTYYCKYVCRAEIYRLFLGSPKCATSNVTCDKINFANIKTVRVLEDFLGHSVEHSVWWKFKLVQQKDVKT